jgi:branched-chain amino acid transport system permease protein
VSVLAQFGVNGVVAGSVYALIALGFALIFTASWVFHFAHGGVYTFAAFAGYTALVTFKLGIVAGFLAAIIVAALLGLIINILLYEPMKAGGVSPFVAMISSFGVLIIITHVTVMIWGSYPVVLSRGGQTTVYRFDPIYTTDAQLLTVGFAAVLAVGLWVFFRHMRLGIAIRAMGNDSELAEIVGMPAKLLRHISFIVGSALVGVSAMLIGLNVGIRGGKGPPLIFLTARAAKSLWRPAGDATACPASCGHSPTIIPCARHGTNCGGGCFPNSPSPREKLSCHTRGRSDAFI